MGKLRIVLLVLVMLVAGCGDDDDYSDNSYPEVEPTEHSNADNLEAESITIEGVKYTCIIYDQGTGAGLWCERARSNG